MNCYELLQGIKFQTSLINKMSQQLSCMWNFENSNADDSDGPCATLSGSYTLQVHPPPLHGAALSAAWQDGAVVTGEVGTGGGYGVGWSKGFGKVDLSIASKIMGDAPAAPHLLILVGCRKKTTIRHLCSHP
jgi:hypothetical protein